MTDTKKVLDKESLDRLEAVCERNAGFAVATIQSVLIETSCIPLTTAQERVVKIVFKKGMTMLLDVALRAALKDK